MIVTLWIAAGVIAVLDWVAVARGDRRTETWAKPLALIALIAVAVAGGAAEDGAGRLLLVALVLGLIGDVMLLDQTSTTRFRAGLGFFLLGHLAYFGCFAAMGLDRPWWVLGGAVVAAVAIGFGRGVLPATHRRGGPALSVPVGVYMAVIVTMTLAAWATGHWLVATGAAIFVASDTILSVGRFVAPVPGGRVATMVTYHTGQALIVAGVLTTLGG